MSLMAVVLTGILLFAVGAAGFVLRGNALVLLLCIEIMLNAVNLVLAGFSRYLYGTEGQVFIFVIMAAGAAAAAVGLAVVAALRRRLGTADMNRINVLKG